MVPPAYTRRFCAISTTTAAAIILFSVPVGRRYILKQITVANGAASAADSFVYLNPTGVNIVIARNTALGSGAVLNVATTVAVNAGEAVNFSSSQPTQQVTITGFDFAVSTGVQQLPAAIDQVVGSPTT